MKHVKRKTRDCHGIDDLVLEDRCRSRTGYLKDFVSDELPANAEHAQDLEPSGIDSKESWYRSAYLVACHWNWSSSRPYSVYKMVDLAASSALATSRKRLKRLGSLKSADAGGKAFTSVSSRHRAWIVGVGGRHGETVIFDTNSSSSKMEKVIQGPNLNSAKRIPVLMTVGEKVYAMCKTPNWVSDPDFPPWFEVLDLSKARVVAAADGNGKKKLHLEDCYWTPLPHPPCMPWDLSPTGYLRLPIIYLVSYVVVGPYILVSFNKQWGTYAFDTNAEEPYQQWHKVDENNLPFAGCATLLASSTFLALSHNDGPINAYRIHVATSDDDNEGNAALKLSVTVLPLKFMDREVDPGPCFFSLDGESFCSLSLSVDDSSLICKPGSGELFPRKAHVNLTTYQLENPASFLENWEEETMLAVNPPEVAVSSQQERTLNIASTHHGITPVGFSLVSMSMSN